MKKILIFLLLVAVTVLSSCGINRVKEPYFTLSGIQYNTGFYNDLYTLSELEFNGDLVGNSSKLWDEEAVIIDGNNGHKISYTPFDMYSLTIGQWKTYLFVPNEQLEDAKSYYLNPDHFDYYYAKVDKLSKEYIDVELISNSISIDEAITSINNITSKSQEKIDIDNNNSNCNYYVFYKISKDGLLTSLRHEIYLIDGNLYLLIVFDGREEQYYGVKLDNDLNSYLLNVIKS